MSCCLEVAAIGVAAGLVLFPWPQHQHVILERDPALSAPYVTDADSEVPTLVLFAVAFIVAPLGLLVLQMLLRPGVREDHGLHSIGQVQLALWQSLAFCMAITGALKRYTGRPRPNFFELCDYRGFATARSTGNYSEYYAATVAGAVGSAAHCGNQQFVGEAFSSFPSGHASLSMAALLTVSQLIWALLPARFPRVGAIQGLRVLLAAWPAIGAALVAGSRTRDNWHNFGDVLAGSALGAVVSLWTFRTRLLPKMLALDTAKAGIASASETSIGTW